MSRWPERLLAWFDAHRREMPWRDHPDPYAVWVSEIMLQQTQVETATPYFEGFVARWPTVKDLAAAELQDVLKEWEGLGYYARARNLHKAARRVCDAYHGRLPESAGKLVKLPGIGPYTAAAIASICWNESIPVVDANVLRVFTRFLAISEPSTSNKTKAQIEKLLQPEIDATDRRGDFNQSTMELGALVCRPRRPDCMNCPLRENCKAYAAGTQLAFPVKRPKQDIPHHEAVSAIVVRNSTVLLCRRPTDAMLGGMWEFPNVEQDKVSPSPELLCDEIKRRCGLSIAVERPLGRVKHAFSHFSIRFTPLLCRSVSGSIKAGGEDWIWADADMLEQLPLSTAQRRIAALARKAMCC